MKTKPVLAINDKDRIAIKSDGTKIPVIDAEFSFLVQPTVDDIKDSIPLDHSRCMYCKACARQFGSELVWVTRTLAYVELKNEEGHSELRRFILTEPAKRKIRNFDAGKNVPPVAVIFAAPKSYQRLDAVYQKNLKSNNKPAAKRKAYVKGRNYHRRPQPAGEALRSRAYGMFQFPKESKT